MKKILIAVVACGVAVAGIVAFNIIMPNRMTEDQRLAAAEAQRRLDQAEAVEAKSADSVAEAATKDEESAAPEAAVKQEPADANADKAEAPKATETPKEGTPDVSDKDVVKVKFVTSKGDFVIEVHRDWAPLGAERFLDLVKQNFFNDVRFFRVVTQPRPFVVQFGISGDPDVSAKWINKRIQDDPVKESNTEGMVTFAMGGPNTRTTQLFINLGDNSNLDRMGFAPFGKVIEGMDVVKSLNSQYQEAPTRRQGEMQTQGNAFLDKTFPGLDYIKSTSIVE